MAHTTSVTTGLTPEEITLFQKNGYCLPGRKLFNKSEFKVIYHARGKKIANNPLTFAS